MSLSTIAEPPTNASEMLAWSFANMANHRDIIRVIFETLSMRLDEYVLDPFDPENMGNWVNLHQTMHDQMTAALGGSSYALTGINWSVPSNVEAWIAAHADEHNRVCAVLGLA